jgi:sRNA-binding protein
VAFRGDLTEEARAAISVLQERWPAAFPKDPELIRPLVMKLVDPIAASTGWSKRYTTGVLAAWKRQAAYSQAVLAYARRYDLAGAVTDEIVGERAREHAAAKLAQLTAEQVKAPDQIPADLITASR